MDNLLVSVIMPAFNAEGYIKESIESVINQTFTNWELIIIDDGSSDKTALIAQEYAKNDNRINYYYQENGKQGKARNLGILHSKGEYIAFLDADDIWENTKLLIQFQEIEKNTADLIFSDSYIFSSQPDYKKKMGTKVGFFEGEDAIRKIFLNNYIPILTVLVKKRCLENVGFFSEESSFQNAEDYHLWMKLLVNGYVFLGINETLSHYRMHKNSATSLDRLVMFPILNSLKDIEKHYPRYNNTIEISIQKRVRAFLCQNNISNWNTVEDLLKIINNNDEQKISVSFSEYIYKILGKRVYRLFIKYI